MKNYEIMLVVDGNIATDAADAVSKEMQAILKGAKDLKEEKLGLKKMAYKIGKCSSAYYFVLTFASDKPETIKEFNRLALINKSILRHLIINLENNYGYNALHNAKKVKASEKKAKIFAERQKKIEEMIAAKKAQYALEKEQKAAAKAEEAKPAEEAAK